ncbi:MAG: MarR family winged helix-turn-helix transcriptional regulator [Mesorhizobium sp.]|nr:MarR family winged helix-turn-helix transcriptional regulator [Mesorhizobium sp.]
MNNILNGNSVPKNDSDEALRSDGQKILEHSIPHHFYRVAVKSTKAKSDFIRLHTGLAMDEWKVLLLIGSFEPLSTKEVSERSTLDKSKVSRTTTALLVAGLVSNHRDKSDRRKLDLKLTPIGREKFRRVVSCLSVWDAKVLEMIAEDKISAFVAALNELDHRLDEMTGHLDELASEI